MKFLTNKMHGILDYVTVVAFALIPTLFSLEGVPAELSYVLAAVHLLLTLLTNFEFGLIRKIPIKLHKIVELIVGPVLIIVPWIFGFSADVKATTVYIVMGVVILLVGQTSKYTEA